MSLPNNGLNEQQERLYHRFIQQKNTQSLTELLASVREQNYPTPIDDSGIREVLFNLSSWDVEDKYQGQLFESVEKYLFGSVKQSQTREWHSWLKESRKLKRHIDVMNPTISQALSEAQNMGKFDDLPKGDYNYLLSFYLKAYGDVLENTDPEDQRNMLPILVEFATITHVFGPNKYSARILNDWISRRSLQPRALIAMSDEQVHYAPIRGVGSPHGVSLTLYEEPGSSIPTRITRTGITGDATLNSQVFISLFAAALACNSEPTFVTTEGGILSLESQKQNNLSQTTSTDNLLSAAFGIDRPVEPSSGTPTLGMSPEEAMMLVSNMFNRFQEVTGLVHVTRWQTKDAIQFEDQITQALGTKDNTPFILTSDAHHSEGAGVIHIIPLLHRNKKGSVVPIEIEISNDLLGAEKIFTLMNEARQEYMLQLISNGRRRFEVAKQGYDLQNKQVERWKSLSEKEKDRECQQDPTVTITGSILNFAHYTESNKSEVK